MRWTDFDECRKSDNVNCWFASEGPCQNPKHWPLDSNGNRISYRIVKEKPEIEDYEDEEEW